MEHENAQLSKELSQITKKYQRIRLVFMIFHKPYILWQWNTNENHNESHNYEKEQIKSKTLEGKVEELEGIIELMKEIVFNDTNDGSK